MNLLAFLTVLLCVHRVKCSCQPGLFTSSVDQVSCCQYCPAGSFMVAECDHKTRSQCQSCPPNTYTSKPNYEASCISCTTKCRGQKQLKAACTNTSNIKCECPSHTYWDSRLLRCTECTKCTTGQKLVSPCGKYKDAECESCRKGMYLNGNICAVCDYCKKGEMVVEECSSPQNTICEKVVFPSSTSKVLTRQPNITTTAAAQPPPTPTIAVTPLQRDDPSTSPCAAKDSQTITWTSGILLGTVIVLLLIVIVLARKLHSCQAFEGLVWKKDCGKKDVIVTKKSSTVIEENNVMFRRTPAHVTEQLGHFLNSNTANNWKILAGKLGYDSTYTQNFEVTPTEATQRLLQDWQQKSGATVFVLYTHLKEIGRDDAASKLLPHLGEQACETRAAIV